MTSGQRGFDALLLGEEPIEGVVEFLLVDLAEHERRRKHPTCRFEALHIPEECIEQPLTKGYKARVLINPPCTQFERPNEREVIYEKASPFEHGKSGFKIKGSDFIEWDE
jgi:hypothetical protein